VETPQLAAFVAGRDNPHGAMVIGVLYLDAASSARDFVVAHRVTWPIVEDSSGSIAGSYDVRGLPESFVIRPDGRLVARIFGGATSAKLAHIISVN
jgi:cytochrome c biogenesis protein CcmG/thiol:disulfide interchange protein DsbE